MKKLGILCIGMILSIHARSQSMSGITGEIAVNASYGSKVFHSPELNGNYEGLAVSYRQRSFLKQNYWEIQVWNTDLTRLMYGKDTTTRGVMKAEYGIAAGYGFHLIGHSNFNITLVPQLVYSYSRQSNFITRETLRLNWNHAEFSIGNQDRIPWGRNYPNRIWFGMGITQKW